MKTLKIALSGNFASSNSISLVNRVLAKEFQKRGHEIFLFPVDGIIENDSTLRQLQRSTLCRITKSKFIPDIFLTHTNPARLYGSYGRINIAVFPWEYLSLTSKVSAIVKSLPSKFDSVFVYSNFIRNILNSHGISNEKIRVSRLGYDPREFFVKAKPVHLPTKKTFRFLYLGRVEPRKGTDVLLRAFCEEFSSKDDVCLVIKTCRYEKSLDWVYEQLRLAKAIKKDPPQIILINREEESVAGYYSACEAGVFPFRGEGYGLPILEAMACGKPVISTKGTGPLDFCNDSNCFFIEASKGKIDGRHCLEPDGNDLKNRMRFLYRNRLLAQAKGEIARQSVKHLTWSTAVDLWLHHLDELLARKNILRPRLVISPKNARSNGSSSGPLFIKMPLRGPLRPKSKSLILQELATAIDVRHELGKNSPHNFPLSSKPGFELLVDTEGRLFNQNCPNASKKQEALFLYLDPLLEVIHPFWKQLLQDRFADRTVIFNELLYQIYRESRTADFIITNSSVLTKILRSSEFGRRIIPITFNFMLPIHHHSHEPNFNGTFQVLLNRFLDSKNMFSFLKVWQSQKIPAKIHFLNPPLNLSTPYDPKGFSPKIHDKQVNTIRRALDPYQVYCLTSNNAYAKLLAVEAMNCKKTLIVFQNSDLASLIEHNQNGFVVPVSDFNAMVKTICQLYKNPKELKRIGNNAYCTITDHKRGKLRSAIQSALARITGRPRIKNLESLASTKDLCLL